MSTTRDLQDLQDHHKRHSPVDGSPARVFLADVAAIEPDGTVTIAPVFGRAGRTGVPVCDSYAPQVSDRVIVTELNGDRQTPVVLGAISRHAGRPVVTGSRSSGAALTSLLSVLAAAGLIVDHTTT